MKLCVVFPAAVILMAASAFAQAPAAPQAAAPAPVRWTQGAKDSELVNQQGVRIEVLHTAGADVAVSLLDLQEYATRAWVQVLNKGQQGLAIDPDEARLQIVKPKSKVLASISADRLAKSIQAHADTEAANQSASGCTMMSKWKPGCDQNASGVAASHDTKQRADAMIDNIRTTALQAQTVSPGGQAQGAVFFPYDHKRKESVVQITLGGQLFEFPFLEEKK